MSQTNVTAAIPRTSVKLLAAGILMAASVLTVSIAVPVIASNPAIAKPKGVVKGAKRVRGKVSRAQVRKACNKAGASGTGWGTHGKKGGYGCHNSKTGSWIDCNSKGKCAGGNTKRHRD